MVSGETDDGATEGPADTPAPTGLGRVVAMGLLVVMGSMWGLQFAMLKLAAQGGYSDLTVLAVALVLLSVAFLVIVRVRGERLVITRRVIVFVTVSSVLGYVAPLLATLAAAKVLAAGLLTLFASLSPVVSVVLVLMFRTEKVSPARICGVALGVASIAVILAPELSVPGFGAAPWMLVALIVPLTYGLESVYVSYSWPDGLSPMVAVTMETLAAVVVTAPLFVFVGIDIPDFSRWSASETAVLVFVGAGVVESVIYFYLIRHTGGVFVNFGAFVSLFAGLAWGAVLFGERHGLAVWAAVGMLVVALWLSIRQPAATAGNPPHAPVK